MESLKRNGKREKVELLGGTKVDDNTGRVQSGGVLPKTRNLENNFSSRSSGRARIDPLFRGERKNNAVWDSM